MSLAAPSRTEGLFHGGSTLFHAPLHPHVYVRTGGAGGSGVPRGGVQGCTWGCVHVFYCRFTPFYCRLLPLFTVFTPFLTVLHRFCTGAVSLVSLCLFRYAVYTVYSQFYIIYFLARRHTGDIELVDIKDINGVNGVLRAVLYARGVIYFMFYSCGSLQGSLFL